MFEITFSVTPTLKQLKQFVIGVEQEVLKDLTEFWHKGAQPLIAEEIARIFVTQGYGTWAPLSPKYALYKSRHYPGRTILRRKDVYFRAATRKESGNLFEVKPDQMIWGVDLGYFANQFGFPYPIVHERGGKNMPQRQVFEMLGNNEKLDNRLVLSLQHYLDKKIRQETKRYFQ